MSGGMHTCEIGKCERQIVASVPLCARCRERLSELSPSTVEKIDKEFLRRQQGQKGAALKFAELIAKATASLHDVPPGKRP